MSGQNLSRVCFKYAVESRASGIHDMHRGDHLLLADEGGEKQNRVMASCTCTDNQKHKRARDFGTTARLSTSLPYTLCEEGVFRRGFHSPRGSVIAVPQRAWPEPKLLGVAHACRRYRYRCRCPCPCRCWNDKYLKSSAGYCCLEIARPRATMPLSRPVPLRAHPW